MGNVVALSGNAAAPPRAADVSHYEKYLEKPGVSEAHTLLKSRIGPVADFVGADLVCKGSDGNWNAIIPFEFTEKGPAVAFERHKTGTNQPNSVDIVLLIDIATTFPRGISTGGTLMPAIFTVTEQDDNNLALIAGELDRTQEVRFARQDTRLIVKMIERTPRGHSVLADLVCSPKPLT